MHVLTTAESSGKTSVFSSINTYTHTFYRLGITYNTLFISVDVRFENCYIIIKVRYDHTKFKWRVVRSIVVVLNWTLAHCQRTPEIMSNSKHKQRINLKFLVKLKKNSFESLRLLRKVYGKECMSRAQVLKLHKQFTDGVDDDECHERSSTWKTVENVERLKEIVRKDSCITVSIGMIVDNLITEFL